MVEEHTSVDVVILGHTFTGICLANLLNGSLGINFKVLLLDISNETPTCLHHTFPRNKQNNEPYKYAAEENYKLKKIFIDFNMNLNDIEPGVKFPYGDIYKGEVASWFAELDSLSKYVCPFATIIESATSSALEKQLDNISVRDHLNVFVKSPQERNAVHEMVLELCGVPANEVSVLFFMWIRKKSRLGLKDKHPTKGYVTYKVKSITWKNNKVCVETDQIFFSCNVVAMAVKPLQLEDIKIDSKFLYTSKDLEIISRMFSGVRRGFRINYLKPFWRNKGYSGEIFSLAGPIRSAVDETIYNDKFVKEYTVCGHLRIESDKEIVRSAESNVKAVIDQLIICFGPEASNMIRYTEEDYDFIQIPTIGDFRDLLKMLEVSGNNRLMEWSCLDIYSNCDIDNSLLAAQRAYVNIAYMLRPQAVTLEELTLFQPRSKLMRYYFWECFKKMLRKYMMNYKTASLAIAITAICIYYKYFHK